MQHAWETREREHDGSWLDRRIELTSLPAESFAWAAVVIVAALIRLPGRTNWPLSPAESAITRDAWALVQGNDLSAAADAHPVVVQLAAFLFFLLGDTDYTARLLPLISGLAIIGILIWLRDWFGRIPALSVATVWTVSPVMTLGTLRLDAGSVLLPVMFLILALTLTLAIEPTRAGGILFGIGIALGLTAHPLGWIVIPLTLFPTMALLRDFRLGGQLLTAAISTTISLLVIISWFATRPSGVWGFFSESLSTLWNDHLVTFGADWQLPLLVLIIDEPVILMLVAVGLVVMFGGSNWDITVPPAIFSSCLIWAFPMLVTGVLLGNKGSALYAVSLFPLIVVAGLALSMLFDGTINSGWQRGLPLLWSLVVIALIVALVRFGDLLVRGPSGDSLAWLINAALLGLLILLPLVYVASRLVRRTRRSLVPVTLLAIVVLTGLISLRTSILIPATGADRPGAVLLAGSSSLSVGRLENRIRTYSRDLTAQIRDIRNPEGGSGLTIVVDESLADPFAWYFRDFPNLLIVQDPSNLPADLIPDAVFTPAADRDQWAATLSGYRMRDYPARFLEPAEQEDTIYLDLLLSATNPLEFRNLVNFAVHRSVPTVLDQQHLTLHLRDDHATPFWGESVSETVD